MGKYSIKELERLSGIKAHTIRIWEKRYNIICPSRTETNIRTYSDEDLKKILNISILNSNGYKISQIANLTDDEILAFVQELAEEKPNTDIFIDQLTMSMIEFDEIKFEFLLTDFIEKYGFQNTIVEIIYPFLQKIGILWLSNNINPIQEHFMSNLIRQKIIVAIDGLSSKVADDAKSVVLFLPENELHEIGLLFYYFLLKNLGYKTYYLGQYVPIKELETSVDILKPDFLVASISNPLTARKFGEFLTLLSTKFPNQEVYLTGKPVFTTGDQLPKNVHSFNDAAHLVKLFS
ncbi:MAG: MerR family transcriptional regulator [Bacteroidota bacterium]